MEIKIENRNQYEGIVYTWIKENENCTIEAIISDYESPGYFFSYKLPTGLILVGFTVEDALINCHIEKDDTEALMKFIKDCSDVIEWSLKPNITIKLIGEKDEVQKRVLNFRDEYVKSINDTLSTTPIKIVTDTDALEMFLRFLDSDKCTRLVYEMIIPIPDINYKFRWEIIVEKIVLGMRTFVSFMCRRADTKGRLKNMLALYPDGEIYEAIPKEGIMRFIKNNDDCVQELVNELHDLLISSFRRCLHMSKEEVDIYVYSNCELI